MKLDMKNLTVRLDEETRNKLKLIAEKEVRPVANQMVFFIREGINRYIKENNLDF